jgi:hypothetical protein
VNLLPQIGVKPLQSNGRPFFNLFEKRPNPTPQIRIIKSAAYVKARGGGAHDCRSMESMTCSIRTILSRSSVFWGIRRRAAYSSISFTVSLLCNAATSRLTYPTFWVSRFVYGAPKMKGSKGLEEVGLSQRFEQQRVGPEKALLVQNEIVLQGLHLRGPARSELT